MWIDQWNGKIDGILLQIDEQLWFLLNILASQHLLQVSNVISDFLLGLFRMTDVYVIEEATAYYVTTDAFTRNMNASYAIVQCIFLSSLSWLRSVSIKE